MLIVGLSGCSFKRPHVLYQPIICHGLGLESALERMPHLQTLDVGCCIMLRRLAPRRCLRLRCIDAAGCSGLRTLICPSPMLHCLDVAECPELRVRPPTQSHSYVILLCSENALCSVMLSCMLETHARPGRTSFVSYVMRTLMYSCTISFPFGVLSCR